MRPRRGVLGENRIKSSINVAFECFRLTARETFSLFSSNRIASRENILRTNRLIQFHVPEYLNASFAFGNYIIGNSLKGITALFTRRLTLLNWSIKIMKIIQIILHKDSSKRETEISSSCTRNLISDIQFREVLRLKIYEEQKLSRPI